MDARFAAFNTLVPYVYPDASVERAVTAALWCDWLFFFDDRYDEVAPGEADADALQATIHAAMRALRGERVPGDDPLLRYAARFRERAIGCASAAWMERFCRSAEDYLVFGAMPAFAHHAAGSTPGLGEYLVQRERDSAVHTALDLIELVNGRELPAEVLGDPALARLRSAAVRTVALLNDVLSYPKEVLVHGNPNNVVEVLRVHEGLSVEVALRRALDLANAEALDVAALSADLRSRHGDEALAAWLAGVCQWQRGHVESSLREARYRSPDSPFVELRPGAARAA